MYYTCITNENYIRMCQPCAYHLLTKWLVYMETKKLSFSGAGKTPCLSFPKKIVCGLFGWDKNTRVSIHFETYPKQRIVIEEASQ